MRVCGNVCVHDGQAAVGGQGLPTHNVLEHLIRGDRHPGPAGLLGLERVVQEGGVPGVEPAGDKVGRSLSVTTLNSSANRVPQGCEQGATRL